MDVYQLYDDCAGNYRDLHVVAPKLGDFIDRFDGTPMKRTWTDVRMEWDPKSRSPKGDFGLVVVVPIFNAKAMDTLEDLLDGNGEILPTSCEGEPWFFFNVTRVIDALDESRSEVCRYLGSTEIRDINKYVFFEEKLTGIAIFKIPQFYKVFVTDPFIERVKSTGLEGFWFPRRWSTDKTAIIDNVW